MILLGDMNAEKGSTCIAEFLKQWRASDFDYGIDWVFFRPANRWEYPPLAGSRTRLPAGYGSGAVPKALDLRGRTVGTSRGAGLRVRLVR